MTYLIKLLFAFIEFFKKSKEPIKTAQIEPQSVEPINVPTETVSVKPAANEQGKTEPTKQSEKPQPKKKDEFAAFELVLYKRTADSTLSRLYYRGDFLCYILEDGIRSKKAFGKTCIWAGTYLLKQRKYGKFYNLYKTKFNHPYVVEVSGVKEFGDILVHVGNAVKDSLGCLLTGTRYATDKQGNYIVLDSTAAYIRFFAAFEKEFAKNKEVRLRITRSLVA